MVSKSVQKTQYFKTVSSRKDRDGKVQHIEEGGKCDVNRQCYLSPESHGVCPIVSSPITQALLIEVIRKRLWMSTGS